MDTRVLKYYSVLCRLRSYSAAARELNITPQGLNLAIKRLEKELGVTLADGSHGPIHPTAHGKAFLAYAEEAVNREDAILAELDEITRLSKGPIRVLCSVGILSDGLREWIGSFRDEKETYVELVGELPDMSCEKALIDGDCDFAVIVDSQEHADSLRRVPMVRDCHFLWARRDDPLASRGSISVRDLDGRSLMSVGEDYHTSYELLNLIHDCGVHVDVRFTSEMIKVYEFALTGGGLGLTGRSHVNAIASERLVGLPFEQLPLSFSLYYLATRKLRESDLAFIAHMAAYRQEGV